tara:strand:+ start:504 stop:671 length:168 start_codon:yes stop_codon:yes gene_type:complete
MKSNKTLTISDLPDSTEIKFDYGKLMELYIKTKKKSKQEGMYIDDAEWEKEMGRE